MVVLAVETSYLALLSSYAVIQVRMGNLLPKITARYVLLIPRFRRFCHFALCEILPFHILPEDVLSF